MPPHQSRYHHMHRRPVWSRLLFAILAVLSRTPMFRVGVWVTLRSLYGRYRTLVLQTSSDSDWDHLVRCRSIRSRIPHLPRPSLAPAWVSRYDPHLGWVGRNHVLARLVCHQGEITTQKEYTVEGCGKGLEGS